MASSRLRNSTSTVHQHSNAHHAQPTRMTIIIGVTPKPASEPNNGCAAQPPHWARANASCSARQSANAGVRGSHRLAQEPEAGFAAAAQAVGLLEGPYREQQARVPIARSTTSNPRCTPSRRHSAAHPHTFPTRRSVRCTTGSWSGSFDLHLLVSCNAAAHTARQRQFRGLPARTPNTNTKREPWAGGAHWN